MAKTRKFASDLATIFMGAGASIKVMYGTEVIDLPVHEFLWGAHDMEKLVVLSLSLPLLKPGEVFETYRTAIRQNSAHALINAAFRVTLEDGVVTAASMAYGLVKERAIFAEAAQEVQPPACRHPSHLTPLGRFEAAAVCPPQALVGQPLTPGTLRSLLAAVGKLELIQETHLFTTMQPEGKDAYRASLVRSFAYKFFLKLCAESGET